MFSLKDIIAATGGKASPACPDSFLRISTDTRTIGTGELFVPLVGENFDGHDFMDAAFEKGAACALCQFGRNETKFKGKPLIEVPDTLRALQDIAAYIRAKRDDLLVVGITGTNGKTTTKEMLASILSLRGPVLKNEGNLNNEIGVPLTLLRLDGSHWASVVEMGMSGFGEIKRLAEIARPSIGVITNIGPGHLEKLGSIEGVARAKAELIDGLPEDGKAVLNIDDRFLKELAEANSGRLVSYGLLSGASVTASGIEESDAGIGFRLITPSGAVDVTLPVMGVHNVYNALAAAAAAWSAGLSIADIKEGLEQFRPVRMRMETMEIGGARVINDAYNANPASMAAALTALASVKEARKIAVLGDMLELGSSAAKSHFDVGRLAGAEGLALLVLVGSHAHDTARGAAEAGMEEDRIIVASGADEAAAVLAEKMRRGDNILVKGSRSMKMERIIEILRSRRLVA